MPNKTIKEELRMPIDWKWKEIPIGKVHEKIYTTISLIDCVNLEKSIPELKELLHSCNFWLQVFEGENINLKYEHTALTIGAKDLEAENARLRDELAKIKGAFSELSLLVGDKKSFVRDDGLDIEETPQFIALSQAIRGQE